MKIELTDKIINLSDTKIHYIYNELHNKYGFDYDDLISIKETLLEVHGSKLMYFDLITFCQELLESILIDRINLNR